MPCHTVFACDQCRGKEIASGHVSNPVSFRGDKNESDWWKIRISRNTFDSKEWSFFNDHNEHEFIFCSLVCMRKFLAAETYRNHVW